MTILTLRTDTSETQISLYNDYELLAITRWESGRDLARDLLGRIVLLLNEHGLAMNDLEALACYSGPGSFTSLRIGIATMNTLAYAGNIAIVSDTDSDWQPKSIARLLTGENEKIVVPMYGSEPNITIAKK
jgi:tRNA threonylcarbamoyladenosine biosynthesis protein TsaB